MTPILPLFPGLQVDLVASRHRSTVSMSAAIGAFRAISSMPLHAQTVPACAYPGCNSVASDNGGNTATGTGALVVTAGVGNPTKPISQANTAAGFDALNKDTTGFSNSAFGHDALGANTTGNWNTAVGDSALSSNVGDENTALGVKALLKNITGGSNTAAGYAALNDNTTGGGNAALGYFAMYQNSTGSFNTAIGYGSLSANTTASQNTTIGYNALLETISGTQNGPVGSQAMQFNTTGDYNAALGFDALGSSTTAVNNTASGYRALYLDTTGSSNTAMGYRALLSTTTGQLNTAFGASALYSNSNGSGNIALGQNAGYSVTGSNNIDIGAMGSAGESGVIRIGSASQNSAFVAGITSAHITGSPVYVSSSGQLGVLASSERYKTSVTSLDGMSEQLLKLRPVSYRLKNDPESGLQYGLIAEEVAKVIPALVIRDADGKIQGVRYDELAPMLVREVQQQHAEIVALKLQASEIATLKQQMAKMQVINEAMQTAIKAAQGNSPSVAMR